MIRCVAAFTILGLVIACSPNANTIDKTNADLSGLTLSSGPLSPAFAAGTTTYTATVESDLTGITVTATTAAPNAKIEARINGGSRAEISSGAPSPALSVNVGANTIEVQVTAEDGTTTKTYTISINRPSADALLSALTTSEGTLNPAFDANTLSYSASVANAVSSLMVTATVVNAGATIQVQVNSGGWQAVTSGSPSPSLALNVGDNLVEVKVTSEDGVTKNTYTITVHRTSVDVDLSGLTPSAGALSPAFSSSTTSYTMTVGSAASAISLTATAAYPLATVHVQVNGGDWHTTTSGSPSPSLGLNVGDNTIVVRVTAEEGNPQKSYSIAIHRLSGNADLSALTISSGMLNPGFSSSATSYTDTVLNSIDSVTVTPTVAQSSATIQFQVNGGGWQAAISGSPSPSLALNLGGNTIEVKVTAEVISISKTYTITVFRRYAGALDIEFAATGTRLIGLLYSIKLQSDGKILIGGDFTSYNGTSRGRIARLNNDGSLDTSFLATGAGADGYVKSIALQSDGKILIGGGFTTYNGDSRGHVARLNSDGSLDTSFLATGAGANDGVYSIELQSDGKIIIGGWFTTYNGTSRGHVARLNSDGNLDTSFLATGAGTEFLVVSITLQTDGKILICGGFTTYNGTSRGRIARLNSDGSLDTSFLATGAGANSEVLSIAVQDDGKILIGGYFTSYNVTSRGHVARLNSDGSLDTSFLTTGAGADSNVNSIAVQSDGKILIGGYFTSYNGTSTGRIARLNSDNSLDSSFLTTGAGADSSINSIAVQSDGKIVVVGSFDTYNGIYRGCIARLWGD